MLKSICFAGLLFVAGCSQPTNNPPTASPVAGTPATPVVQARTEPTQEIAVDFVRKASLALESKKYDEAATYFKIPEGVAPDKVAKELGRMVEKKEVSSAGVEKLAKNAKWGKLEEVFGEKAQRWAERSKVPVQDCYGLGLEPAEVGLYWDGAKFLIIRLDDVGKL